MTIWSSESRYPVSTLNTLRMVCTLILKQRHRRDRGSEPCLSARLLTAPPVSLVYSVAAAQNVHSGMMGQLKDRVAWTLHLTLASGPR